jgi:hypothetical protein
LSDNRKSDDEMSLSSGSSVSDDSGGSVLEREETRHQQHVKFIERMDTAKSSCGNGPEKSTEKLITNTIPCVDGLPVLEWNFYRIVLMYIVVTSLVGGTVIWHLTPGSEWLNGWFLAVSAVTSSGLSPVEMRTLSTGSLIAIFPLMVLGGATTICFFPLMYRRWMFSRYRKSIESLIADTLARQVAVQIDTENAHDSWELGRSLTHLGTSEERDIEEEVENDQVDFEWPEDQDRPSFQALVVSYKRRDR